MAQRSAVVAVGSNASPSRLVDKCGPDAVIPVGRVDVAGWAAVYSAHISRYGSIAATLWPDPSATTSLAVILLDADQLQSVDATEPNYQRVDLGPILEGSPGAVTGYRSWRGALGLDGSPVRLAEVPGRSHLPAMRQIEVLDAVAVGSGLASDGAGLAAGVQAGGIAQEAVADWMADGRSIRG